MITSQIWACLFSLLIYLVAYGWFRENGATRLRAVALSSPFFVSPLFVAVRGSNSFVHLMDLAGPLLIILAIRDLKGIKPIVLKMSGLLLLACGVIPLIVGSFFSANNLVWPVAAISCYRVLTTVCVMVCTVHFASLRPLKKGLRPFVALGIIVAGATILTALNWVDSDYFYFEDNLAGNGTVSEVGGYISMGMFRGSLGIVGVIAMASFVSWQSLRLGKNLWATSAFISGIIIVIGTMSKTSTFVGLIIIGYSIMLNLKHRNLKALLWILSFTFLGFFAFSIYLQHASAVTKTKWTDIFDSNSDARVSMTVRESRWDESFEHIVGDKSFLFGTKSLENVGYYHNEYLGLLMNGGIICLSAYLVFLLFLYRIIFTGMAFTQQSLFLRFAQILFISGIIHGFSVVNFYPGLFFAACTGMASVAYGLAIGQKAALAAEDANG